MVSEDRGATWTTKSTGFAGIIWAIAVDPANDDRWFALTDSKLYQTMDAGVSWSEITGASCIKLSFSSLPTGGNPHLYLYLN